MRITFLGHACFLIQTGDFRILTDPFSQHVGYKPVGEFADIVTLSHENPRWHSCLQSVRGDYQVVRGLEWLGEKPLRVGSIQFHWIPVFENLPHDGPNAMLKLTSEGLRVLHMGDIGHPVSDELLEKCGAVDILLAPAGGAPTIELDDLMKFIEKLKPKIVIPMHFLIPDLAMSLRPVEDIIALWDASAVRRQNGSSLNFNKGIQPKMPTLCILEPKRK